MMCARVGSCGINKEVAEVSEFEIVSGYFGPQVRGKLANMRKPQTFIVRPASDGSIYIQSDKSTGSFDFRTRKGVLNTKGTTFAHLNPALGAKAMLFPAEFVKACLEACPADGSETTRGGVTIVNTIKVI
jgi:hypothetical protein